MGAEMSPYSVKVRSYFRSWLSGLARVIIQVSAAT